MKPSRELQELAEHIHFIYVDGKLNEVRNTKPVRNHQIFLSESLLAEWSNFVKNSRLLHMIKPNTLYSSDNLSTKNEWNSIMYNGGVLLGLLKFSVQPFEHYHLREPQVASNPLKATEFL
jgi:hypothetical protein